MQQQVAAFNNDHGNGNPSNDVVHVAHQLIAAPVAGLFWDPVRATAASALEPEIRAAAAEGRASVLQEQLRTAETRIGELQERLQERIGELQERFQERIGELQEQLRTADVRAAVAEARAAAAAEARAAADVRAAAAEARAAVAEARASAVVLAAAAGRTGGPLLPQD